ncbi:tRNA (adenosine(37)-N6)-threonylcarbamoyltransferase complex ATPase subunit type 1 TsaE [Candidatus Saccharibacteria bacterium]|nr:tRNA (adenosine(37)-N6)-threonylcarbamoyltransferase complex ATPase subunit type 1 TsaE [Candidatus Saccharibacteria bacterium]
MKISSEQEMYDFGKQFAKLATPVIELIGDVGAGKTTFTRGLAAGLGVTHEVTSPSFTISKSYATSDGHTLTHYDFYRLADPGLMLSDLAEHIKNHDYVVVEWGKSVENILPDDRTTITIRQNDDGTREIGIAGGAEAEVDGNRIGIIRVDTTLASATAPSSGRVTSAEGDPRRACEVGEDSTRQDPSGTRRTVAPTNRLPLFLDTSSPITILKLGDTTYEWPSGHDLAEKLLSFIHDKLTATGHTWHDISDITFMSGPGSFTGLRIGAAVVNALAHELNIPLRNHHGEIVPIIIPDYGRSANITAPRK